MNVVLVRIGNDQYAIHFSVLSSGPYSGKGMNTMANNSILREAIIAGLIATIAVPLLWVLGASVDPGRNVHSPGLDLAMMTIVGAGSVMLLRSIWRESAASPADHARYPEYRLRHKPGSPYPGELCQR